MKKTILITMLLALLIFSVAYASIIVKSVYPFETSGKNSEFVVVVMNDGDTSSQNSQIFAYIPGLDQRGKTPDFKIKALAERKVYLEVENSGDVKPDYYPIIVTFTNDEGVRKKTHSWIYIE
jgi:uncharacterized membrane protein